MKRFGSQSDFLSFRSEKSDKSDEKSHDSSISHFNEKKNLIEVGDVEDQKDHANYNISDTDDKPSSQYKNELSSRKSSFDEVTNEDEVRLVVYEYYPYLKHIINRDFSAKRIFV